MSKDKLAVGLGGYSVFENDITLHHIYGIPYIPGQAIKGNLRSYMIRKYCDCDESKIFGKDALKNIFGVGSEEDEGTTQGKVIFLDSYPIGKFEIRKDIIATHYNSYYQQGALPLDSEEPIINNFMVVKNTSFNFNIGVQKDIINEKCTICKNKSIIEFIEENMIDVLKYEGLGAKTSVGYGFFDKDEDFVKQEEAKIKAEEKLIKEKIEKRKFEEETKGMTELQVKIYKLKKNMNAENNHHEIMMLFNDYIDKVHGDERIELAEFVKDYLISVNKWNMKNGPKLNKKIDRIKEILNCN